MDFIDIIGTLFDNSINHVVAIANQIKDLRLNKNQQDINEDLYEQIRISKETKEKCKGYYDSYDLLSQQIKSPEVGDWAIVKKSDGKWYIYNCIVKDTWRDTEQEYSTQDIIYNSSTEKLQKTIAGETSDVLDLKDKLVRHIFLTESEYRQLQNKDENTLYFITEDEEVHSSGSRLGEDTFPFTLE